jgi:type VI secretion system protein
MARGLLQRIEQAARSGGSGTAAGGGGRSAGAGSSSTQISILEHVQTLLNTRQGSSQLDASYGIPDITDVLHSLPGGMPVLRGMIEDCIRRHEPRLAGIRVASLARDDTELYLRFEVQAKLATGGSIRFETEVSRAGRVRVR